MPYHSIVDAWLDGKTIEAGDRHRTSLNLADHLRYITDNDAELIETILRQTPFVDEIVRERDEDVAATVASAQKYQMYKNIPQRMREALERVGIMVDGYSYGTRDGGSLSAMTASGGDVSHGVGPSTGSGTLATSGGDSPQGSIASDGNNATQDRHCGGTSATSQAASGHTDIYSALPLDQWAADLTELSEHYPCMKALFANVHPRKYPAVLFSAAAMFGTLMTRTWYHFW